MLKNLEEFLVERALRLWRTLLYSLFFAPALSKCVPPFVEHPLLSAFVLILAIGLITDFVLLIARSDAS
jgi:hypothetical protein